MFDVFDGTVASGEKKPKKEKKKKKSLHLKSFWDAFEYRLVSLLNTFEGKKDKKKKDKKDKKKKKKKLLDYTCRVTVTITNLNGASSHDNLLIPEICYEIIWILLWP